MTGRRDAEQRQALLMAELNHRVKNTLATVQSLAQQTARGAGGGQAQRFVADFQARLLALARGHDLLTARTWRGAPLDEVAQVALAAWRSPTGAAEGDSRMGAAGPEVWLAPKQALGLALALHELATNAAKHGALSRPEGRVALRWWQDEEGMVTLEWSEGGGPPVRQPGRRGFGTRLLERGLPTELGPEAAVSLNYELPGLTATIRFRGQRAEADDVAAAAKAPPGARGESA